LRCGDRGSRQAIHKHRREKKGVSMLALHNSHSRDALTIEKARLAFRPGRAATSLLRHPGLRLPASLPGLHQGSCPLRT
jgi:hypothetical protein